MKTTRAKHAHVVAIVDGPLTESLTCMTHNATRSHDVDIVGGPRSLGTTVFRPLRTGVQGLSARRPTNVTEVMQLRFGI